MNYTDGYFIEIPEKWDSTITASLNVSQKSLTIYRLNNVTGTSAEILLKISATAKADGLVSAPQGSFAIAETESNIYYVMLGDYQGIEALSVSELKKMFHIISKTEG